jgi:predicted dehydrogenase
MNPPPLTLGMIGGGQGAFIGAVHRTAAALDGHWRLIAGALSSTPEKSLASGRELGLAPDRIYPTWRDMLAGELARPAAHRIDAVSIVTPNSTHFEVAHAFASAGFHVICDKPLVVNSDQAAKLVQAVDTSGVVFAVTYNYTGYPMVKQAAAMVRAGELGAIRKVIVEYHQGWLATSLESTGQKQAAWRTDPALAGAGGAIGDIGSHCENLLSSVTGLEIDSLAADVTTFVPGRKLDDDASVLLRLKGAAAPAGARAVITVTQIAVGEQNNLTLRIHGERGSLAWKQETPNTLTWHRASGATQIFSRAGANLHESAARSSRLPPGHPEGFHEAFANIYAAAAAAIRAKRAGQTPSGIATEYPTVHDGARGVRFIERVLESSRSNARWLSF